MAEPRGLIDGKVGESLFHQPLSRYFRENAVPELFRKVEGVDDERLLAIITALIVENRLESCLQALMPRYATLSQSNETTFSAKIRILEALNLVPLLLTEEAHLIRKIRNAFAHDLEKLRLDELEPELTRKLTNAARRAYAGKTNSPTTDVREAFQQVSFHCIIGFDLYGDNIAALNEKIRKAQFVSDLEADVKARNDRVLAEALSHPPIGTEQQGDLLVTRYPGGLAVVSNASSDDDAV